MKIALHNHHLQPWFEYHPYIRTLIEKDEVCGIFISDRSIGSLSRFIKNRKFLSFYNDLKINKLEIFFDINKLNAEYDVLIDLNFFITKLDIAVPKILKKFHGIKIFHIGDYFGYHSARELHSRLAEIGASAIFGYCMHDRYCDFFKEFYPSYIGKTWGIPFGYSERFIRNKDFSYRKNKAISLGSLNKLSNERFKKDMFFEAIPFFKNEVWFHRFRESLFSNRLKLKELIDCGIPDPFNLSNQRLDLVSCFNDYKFFVTCESIFNFPTAKVYEGTASGSVLLASNHLVYDEIGFQDNKNCILFAYEDLESLLERINYYIHESQALNSIANESYKFTTTNFNSKSISNFIIEICNRLMSNPHQESEPYKNFIHKNA